MDPHRSAQDVLRCHLCETPGPPMYCDICHIHLCKTCVGEHVLEEEKEHRVVPFKTEGFAPECLKHPTKLCDLKCEQCNIPICVECVSSSDHLGHIQVEISKIIETKKEILQKDLNDLKNIVYPKYQQFAYDLHVQKANLNRNSQRLVTAISKHGEDLHQNIDFAIEKLKSDVDEIECKYLVVLNKQIDEITRTISEITESIAELNKIQNSGDVSHFFAYQSRNAEFKRVPSKPTVFLPEFIPQKINKETFGHLLGSLSNLSTNKEDSGNKVVLPNAMSSSLDRLFIDEPRVVININTEYGNLNKLRCVSGLNDDGFWTSGQDNLMRLYNLHGKLMKSIQTKSGTQPWDIAVTQSGELVYNDLINGTVNIVKKKKVKTVIRPHGWKPFYVCSAFSGDFLVVMISDDKKETKVVRYSGSTEKQTIQHDDKGKPLYSSEPYPKYISENKNLDICVADNKARSVVVVNQAGILRFIYTSSPTTSTKKLFKPTGITTDSFSRILTSDGNNNCIHILDKDGRFLRFIDNCYLVSPSCLCMDTTDNVLVAEWESGKVKKIQYYK
uniref:B box-type domain-containing protein n=2 Tax=Magallana gigas TaxID=29159 RepID=A0A8W8JFP8_MAGGI|nr:uncharacterized protein LOC105336573 [Crassostrea gigas]XP_011439239.2 uncharacterized protein LOC105336573 [Crassostrea gigas]XP_019926309.2 uncharacterized protein LOC105336573 [Crassostrea gigas]